MLTAIATATALLAAAPAAARDAAVRDRAESLAILHSFARCVAGSEPRVAAALLAAPHGSAEEARQLAAVTERTACLSGAASLAGNSRLFRGAIAEALYERRRAGVPAAASPPESYAVIRARLDQANGDKEGRAVALWVAHCAAHADPASVDALLRTRPHSARERAALAGLAGRLGACLDSGHSLTADAASMRGFLAEALYRMAERPPA